MHALTDGDMLAIWERGVCQSTQHRALTILSVGCEETSMEMLADLSIGQRDRQLMSLRALTFGTKFSGLVTCSNCREQVEITFNENEICSLKPDESVGPVQVCIDEHAATVRLPTTADLLQVESVQDPADAKRKLISLCVTDLRENGEDVSIDAMSDNLLNAVTALIEERDPFIDVHLQVTCAGCQKQSQILFDIGMFFWREIASRAQRVLSEVHVLARAYAWSEADILSLSAARRELYLEMVS